MGLSKAEVGLQPTFSSAKIGFANGRMLAPFSPPKKGTHQQKKDTNSSHKRQKNKKSKKSNKQPQKRSLIQKLEFPSHLFMIVEQKTHRIPRGTPVKSNGAIMPMADPWRKLGKAAKTTCVHGNLRGPGPNAC